MNLAQKDILKLTLMAFDNNSANIRNLRQDSKNKFSIREMDSLLKIEQKMDEVKSVIMRVLIDADEITEKRKENSRQMFLHDNVD